MAASSKGAVLAAVIGNAIITVLKAVAFAVSGSGAMLSESIHSAADSGNQLLLYLGVRRSERAPDAMFHYGYGGERFLFALLSAVGIFILGCGVTLYHGIHTLLHPAPIQAGWLTYGVLAISFVIDGVVFFSALRAVRAKKGAQPLMQFIRTTSDPTVLAVLFEDAVATLGVVIAVVGISLSQYTGNPVWDSLSTLAIGGMLGCVALWLGWRNRLLILGPAIPKKLQAAVVEFLRSQPTVDGVRNVKTRIVAADHFRLSAEIDFDGAVLAQSLNPWVSEQLPTLQGPDSTAAFTAAFGDRLLEELAREVDRIEAALIEKYPRLRYLDLESDLSPEGYQAAETGG